jgi:hypothetical protein
MKSIDSSKRVLAARTLNERTLSARDSGRLGPRNNGSISDRLMTARTPMASAVLFQRARPASRQQRSNPPASWWRKPANRSSTQQLPPKNPARVARPRHEPMNNTIHIKEGSQLGIRTQTLPTRAV